jgi:hypothetical protein
LAQSPGSLRRTPGTQPCGDVRRSVVAEVPRVVTGAMNELVAGEITAQQASNLWSSSRIGAAQRVARYQAIDRQSLGGRTSIGTWRHHIHDMEQLRAGRISVPTALQRWHTNWRKGAAELRRYRHQRDAAVDMTIC